MLLGLFAWQRLCHPKFSLFPRSDWTGLETLAGFVDHFRNSHSPATIILIPSSLAIPYVRDR